MNRTNKAIASLLVLLMLISSVLLAFTSCVDDNGGNNGEGSSGNGGNQSTTKSSYSVTVITEGGMAMANLPIYVYEYEDGALGEMIDGGYGATDANGKATFSLPENGSYAARIDLSIPEGYDVESYYPLVKGNTPITVSSAVIPESSLVGVSYSLGDVIRDFSVSTNILEMNEETGNFEFVEKQFTLSEVLREKDAVVINFWYTTCSWCVTEFPLMQTAYEKYGDDIAIVALDPYTDETISMIKNFQADMGLTFNVGQDLFGLSNAFGVTGYPTSVVVDRYGVIAMIEAGAITSQRAFDVVFDHFTGDDYEQKLIVNYEDIVPKEKPNVEMPSSDEISDVFDKGALGEVEYLPYPDDANDEEKEYSWPFLTGKAEKDGVEYDVIYTSNAGKESSFAQMIFDVNLEAGQVLAFDYYSSTERGADILYVVVNNKDIYSISGENEKGWETCYAYVAEETATYTVGLIYAKDSSDDVGDDTVYLKDLRIVSESDIDRETYIYRFAATNPDRYSNYQDFVTIVYNEKDGYYHVDSADGPLLLADLMGYTRFSEDDYVYNMCLGKDYEADLVQYCNYASNASLYGLCPVNEELKGLLLRIADDYGSDIENEWLELCCYYDAYGTGGKQLEDPIKGLALFSAYDVILSNKGATDFPNEIEYNRVIMPRGLLYKFTPEQSGTYLITSRALDENNPGQSLETNAWIFTSEGFSQRQEWYSYENVDRFNDKDYNNCYMMVYLEAGKDYFIDIAYYDVYQEGTINFRVERLGGEGFYRFSLASPGYFTSLESITGELTKTIAGGIEVELGSDGIWREKRTDGREGSILYADFTMKTPIFSHSIEAMIDRGAFDFSRTEDDQLILNYLALNDNDPEKCDAYLREEWGDDYETYAELYQVEDVYAGIYHGEGEDYTDLARSYLSKKIVAGYNAQLKETIASDDARIGCVVVTEELAELLQILMDKYTFEGVENSWRKVCYYTQYFCAETPN